MSFAVVAVAASAVVGAAGAIYAGKQQKAAAEYNAKVDEQHAQLAFEENQERVTRMRRNNKKLMARNIATRAAQGVEISAGSSLMLEAEQAEALELAVLEQGRRGDVAARSLRSGARITRFEGAAAAKASYFQAGASLLRGAGNVGSIIESRQTT